VAKRRAIRHLAIVVAIAVVVAACTSDAHSSAAPETTQRAISQITCEAPSGSPSHLTCAAAVTAVSLGLGPLTTEAVSAEFHSGRYCPDGMYCAIPIADSGYVIVTFGNGTSLVADVRVTVTGAVEVTRIDDRAVLDRGCPPQLVSGNLVARGSTLDIEVAPGGEIITVHWPFGYRTGSETSGIVLTDLLGHVMAHAGDFVMVHGTDPGDGSWLACGDPDDRAQPRDAGAR
jgi:hypothetical protein